MKKLVRVLRTEEWDICAIRLVLPCRYKDKYVPHDFPGRTRKVLTLTYDLLTETTGRVRDWPADRGACDIQMKVGAEGSYEVLGPNDVVLFSRSNDYVPRWVPRDGDHIIISIAADGTMYDLPRIRANDFFDADEGR
ncbi:MAG TPA: hypothetical protein VEI97_14800 [bacterium]|nr:hypothetical protein [bacterium]